MSNVRPYPAPVDGLVIEHDAAVLRIRLDRPARRNAMTDAMVFALLDTIEAAGNDASVRVIALSGTGEHFCSGFDLGERRNPRPDAPGDERADPTRSTPGDERADSIRSIPGDERADPTRSTPGEQRPRAGATQRALRSHVNRLVPAMLATQTPIVAAVTGYAIGLGLNLALAADFAVVAADARLRAPFTTLGFTPDSGASWLLPRLAGVARAKEMLLLGREVSGADAAAWGMVTRAVPADEVAGAAEELVSELASAATVAVGLAKVLVHRSLAVDLERHLAEEALAIELASRSDDFHEYARARREQRPPTFEGR